MVDSVSTTAGAALARKSRNSSAADLHLSCSSGSATLTDAGTPRKGKGLRSAANYSDYDYNADDANAASERDDDGDSLLPISVLALTGQAREENAAPGKTT